MDAVVSFVRSLLVVAVGAAIAAAAIGGATPRSGLYGVVIKGPTKPVCSADEPCDAPARVTLVFSRAGTEIGRVRSSAEGRFRIALAPGAYSVRTVEQIGPRRLITPRNVWVRRAHWDRIAFFLDTGIR